jgi:hypothetical protein
MRWTLFLAAGRFGPSGLKYENFAVTNQTTNWTLLIHFASALVKQWV